jgi:hypothetical protein
MKHFIFLKIKIFIVKPIIYLNFKKKMKDTKILEKKISKELSLIKESLIKEPFLKEININCNNYKK